MNWGATSFLWLLLLVPALLLFFAWAWRARRRLMTQFIQARLLPSLLADVSPARQKLRLAFLLAGVALLVLALARPQWGFHLEEVRQHGLDIVVAIDTSRSMLANDVAPSRLERAKLEASALQQLCKADRLGLVAFAGSAFLQCPLSLDDDAFRQGLEALDVNIIPQGGTALAEAIKTSLTAFKEKTDNHKVLVLFSDGEDHDGQALEAAREAAQEGLRVFTIGVGTPNGELLSAVDEQGRRSFIKDADGNAVKSRLNEPLLREIAAAGHGFYLPLVGAKTMDTLYERGLAPLPRTDSDSKTVRQYHERFQWFLGLGILFLLAETLWPETQVSRAAKAEPARIQPPQVGVGAAAAVLLAFAVAGQAASPAGAMREYQKGRYDRALGLYEKLSSRAPQDARLHFNTGAAAYQEKEYDQALKEFSASLASPDLGLQEKTYYNLGNTHYRLGENASDQKKQMADWQHSVSSFESALKLDPKDADAQANLEFVKKKIEELKQQQQQNQDKNQDKDQQDKDQKDKNQQNQKDQNQQNKDGQQDKQQQQDQQSKQDQQKQGNQQKPEDDPQQQKNDQQSGQKDQQSGQKQQPDQGQPSQDQQKNSGQEQDAAQAGKMMQMTPQQARQLLDAQRADEKPMPFWRLLRTNRVERAFKNW